MKGKTRRCSDITKQPVHNSDELTVPFESNMSGSHEYNTAKYEELQEQLHHKDFTTELFAIAVRARGFVGSSAYSVLKNMGLTSQVRSKCLKKLLQAAENGSYWIWLKRKEKAWST